MAKLLIDDDDEILRSEELAGHPFTDSLDRCERKWTRLLASQRYESVRLKRELHADKAARLPAPAM